MSIVKKLIDPEYRSSGQKWVSAGHPRDPLIADILGMSGSTAAGVSVSHERASQIPALFACIRILSSAMATMPLELYKRLQPSGREKATDFELYRKLHTQPNSIQSSFEWRELMAVWLLMRGNAYNFKDYDRSGELKNISPLQPDRMRPFKAPDGSIGYAYDNDWGEREVYLQEEIMHFRGMSFNGLVGLDPITHHKESIGLSIAADEFGARYFGNGTVIDGVLHTDGELGDEAYERLKKDWKDRRQGVVNAHKPIILEDGLKWQPLTVEPEKAQFLETRKYQRSDIAMIYGVPPHMIGDTEKSTSFGTGIESQNIAFLVYSLMPWLVRNEQVMDRDLLDESRYRGLYTKHNVAGMLRADTKTRGEFYKTLWGLAAINANEIRELEEMNPYDGGNIYFAPLNMADASKLEQLSDQAGDELDTPQDEGRMLESFHYRMVEQTAQRIVSCECRALERIVKSASNVDGKIAEFINMHGAFLQRHLEPVAGNLESVITQSLLDSFKKQVEADLSSASPVQALSQRINKWRNGRASIISRSISLAALDGLKAEL